MSSKTKRYVVWRGHQPGIYFTWPECSAQVSGYPGAEFKAFDSQAAAEDAFRGRYLDYKESRGAGSSSPPPVRRIEELQALGVKLDSLCVDAACSGNPGRLEYRCVSTASGEEIFARGPFECGTNNIGEFLAIADAFEYCKREGKIKIIYSDSRIAMGWIARKKCNTKLPPGPENLRLFDLIRKAEAWLATHKAPAKVLKWETAVWGEIPADYGRK